MIGRMRRTIGVIAGIVFCLGSATAALAQTKPAPTPPVKTQPKPKAPAQAEAAKPQVVMPDAEKIVLLLRNTLITLNDALQTGNFTVFRDKAAPGFQNANSAARLGQAFADLAARRIDLSTVSVVSPQLSENPTLDQKQGMLRLKGFFPLQPTPVAFEMLYQSVDGYWRLFGLSVQPASAAPAASQAPTKMPAPPREAN
jgi:hypothetical protein